MNMVRVASASGRIVAIASMLASLGGCVLNHASPETALYGGNLVNPAGANGMLAFTTPKISTASLAKQICPSGPVPAAADGDQLVAALACFNTEVEADPNKPALIARRNAVQDYMIMWSNQTCSLWFTYIERADALNRGTFNVLSVVTGGVGAMVSGPAARVLSGVSGISSGTGAAIDAAMLHGLTEGLILPRVVTVRTTKLTAVYTHRKDDLATYPMARALADALDYHGACNLSSALQQDSPTPQLGQQLSLLSANAAMINSAHTVINGARPPLASDVKPNAVFLTDKNAVLEVVTVPASGTGDQTVTYTVVGPDEKKTAATPADFLSLVADGLVLKSS